MKTMTLIGAALSLALATGCQSTQQRIEEDGAVSFTRNEVVAFLSGKTERWTRGAGYFAPDGGLEAIWRGEPVTGTWHATDAGEVCYDVEAWGETPCTAYYHRNDKVVTVYKDRLDEAAPDDYLDGRQLAAF